MSHSIDPLSHDAGPKPDPAAAPRTEGVSVVHRDDSCSELLSAYQGTVVHDLRGELNGLLLTIDFVRRQVSLMPNTPPILVESLQDLDKMRRSLTSTLNELDVVGHARRVTSGRQAAHRGDANLGDVISAAVRQMEERARRRDVQLALTPAADIYLSVDPVLVQLTIQRVLFAAVEGIRKSDVRIWSERRGEDVAVHVRVGDATPFAQDTLTRAISAARNPMQQVAVALQLAGWLAESLGGVLTREPDGAGLLFTLKWPLNQPPAV
jgi:K+-sensing histidine kinase KdpD